jgi:hypothetical protein
MGKVFEFKRPQDKLAGSLAIVELGKIVVKILIPKIKKFDEELCAIGYEIQNNDDLILAIDFHDWDEIVLFQVPFDGDQTIESLTDAIVEDIKTLREVV